MNSRDQLAAYLRDTSWIPVSDWVPEVDEPGEFLAFNPIDGIFIASQHPTWWNHKDKRRGFDGEYVTHWMPLPAAPEVQP